MFRNGWGVETNHVAVTIECCFLRRFQEMLQLFTVTQATTPDGCSRGLWHGMRSKGQIIKMSYHGNPTLQSF